MNITRRTFLKLCGASTAAFGLSATDFARLEKLFAEPNGPSVLWLQGSGCTGCTESFLNYISPDSPRTAADVLIQSINLAYHPNVMALAGQDAVQEVERAYDKGNYILAVEGGVPTAFGGNACLAWSYNGEDVTFQQAVLDLSAQAAAILCIGTCASWGGVAAAPPNPTGVKGVKALTGKTTINIAGCPPHPDWIVWSVVQLLLQKTILLDSSGRPKALEMGALFGGRMPHPPTYVPGGFTTTPRPERISKFKTILAELLPFIEDVYLGDVEMLSSIYGDYFSIGRGLGNLLAFGVFDLNAAGTTRLLKRGRVSNGSSTVGTLDAGKITEQVTHSWYAESTNNLKPASGSTVPQFPKAQAYSWLKAPRYSGVPYEAGPLARMWINGDYRHGISVMDRHMARAEETLKIAQAMQTWVDQLRVGSPVYVSASTPASATSLGLTEAPRGALGHWVQISKGRIARYQVVTPTCWNASPRDSAGNRGPIEAALIGTPVQDTQEPVEVIRVIHSFDPCLSCAVHVMRPAEGSKIFVLGHSHGPDDLDGHSHHEGHSHNHAADGEGRDHGQNP